MPTLIAEVFIKKVVDRHAILDGPITGIFQIAGAYSTTSFELCKGSRVTSHNKLLIKKLPNKYCTQKFENFNHITH